IEQRLDALEQTVSALYEVAPAAAQFSESALTRLTGLTAMADRLHRILADMREARANEMKIFDARVTAIETASAREAAFQSRQLAAVRAELNALSGALQREHDQERTNGKIAHLTESVDNVVRFVTAEKHDGAA